MSKKNRHAEEPPITQDGTMPEPPLAVVVPGGGAAEPQTPPTRRRKRTKAEMIADLEQARLAKLSPIEAFTAARIAHDEKIKEAEANIKLAQENFEEARDAREKFLTDARAALGL